MYPTSPFLSVYYPQIGSMISIFQRITGVSLTLSFMVYFPSVYLKNCLILKYLTYLQYYYLLKSKLNGASIGVLFLFIVFTYHLLFTVRYLVWSITGGDLAPVKLNIAVLYKTTTVLVAGTVINTLLIWLII